jgi:hypothetical protein
MSCGKDFPRIGHQFHCVFIGSTHYCPTVGCFCAHGLPSCIRTVTSFIIICSGVLLLCEWVMGPNIFAKRVACVHSRGATLWMPNGRIVCQGPLPAFANLFGKDLQIICKRILAFDWVHEPLPHGWQGFTMGIQVIARRCTRVCQGLPGRRVASCAAPLRT